MNNETDGDELYARWLKEQMQLNEDDMTAHVREEAAKSLTEEAAKYGMEPKEIILSNAGKSLILIWGKDSHCYMATIPLSLICRELSVHQVVRKAVRLQQARLKKGIM